MAGEFVAPFGIDTIIALLYKQFLQHIVEGQVKGKPLDLYKLAQDLQAAHTAYRGHTITTQELRQQSENHWSLQERTQKAAARPKYYEMQITLNRRDAFRGEVALEDMQHIDPSFHMTLEQLLSLLFAQFMGMVRTNQKVVLDELIASLSEE
ncbi:hypothetical protein FPZ49_24505 [Paenibacillus cremeus]|uniref:Uncharacterized protein n=1 Tax=Paenibacillus cremeus TaxID=2163881 RepID=A0A559K589_9BACL|nr:hypothetical protein FPZ49_24505 [Paenibacillus cremeus]